MRLGVAKERRTFLDNIVEMWILCVQYAKKFVRELVLLWVCPLPSQMMFLLALPSLMIIAWILQFTVNIQNPRESSGMMMTTLIIFHNLFLHLI